MSTVNDILEKAIVHDSPYDPKNFKDYNKSYQKQYTGSYSILSVVGFVLAIGSYFCAYAGIIPAIAVIISLIGGIRCIIKGQKGGKYACAGIILGVFAFLFGMIQVLVTYRMMSTGYYDTFFTFIK